MSLIEASNHLRIPFEAIKEATQNFTTVIGGGGYGPVYKGELTLSGELTLVAVKQLQKDSISGQGLKEFLTEIQLLSRYKHQNLVSLVGFCVEHDDKFLVYEYAEHGSLDSYLEQTKTKPPLTWKQRIKICIDVARGLDHLHNHVAQNHRVLHRDIKSANILLGHNWKAMISDFGLSRIGRANESITYLITNPCGTFGYCDPAYFNTGIFTKESDVYSFGVVLFEVLCGRLCYKNVKTEILNLVIDPDLNNYADSDSMKEFLEVAYQCLLDDRRQRPSMSSVLQKLEKALKLLEPEELLEQQLEDEVEKIEVKTVSPSNIEMDNPLPGDYKQFIYYSNTEMMKKPQCDVIFPTKEEAYSILSAGVLIKVSSQVNMWFWIAKFNGKKCFVLSPTLLSYDKQLVKLKHTISKEKRIGKVLHLHPPSSKTVVMHFQVPNGLFSTNSTYGCYLVYKMPQDFVRETKVKMKLDDDDHDGNLTYLSISQSPGPNGAESSMTNHNTIQMARKRNDGWLEVNLGNKTDVQWMSTHYGSEQFDYLWRRESIWRSWFLLCTSCNESANVSDNKADDYTEKSFTLDSCYFSNISVVMCPIDDATACPELLVQGIEFRPM